MAIKKHNHHLPVNAKADIGNRFQAVTSREVTRGMGWVYLPLPFPHLSFNTNYCIYCAAGEYIVLKLNVFAAQRNETFIKGFQSRFKVVGRSIYIFYPVEPEQLNKTYSSRLNLVYKPIMSHTDTGE